ncbi:MAG: hypothetical protein OEN50_03135 [Deltaproteobacteria bacterium]|nr:hypothetical protein [Deltaproteobacteria bacterium]
MTEIQIMHLWACVWRGGRRLEVMKISDLVEIGNRSGLIESVDTDGQVFLLLGVFSEFDHATECRLNAKRMLKSNQEGKSND